MVSVQAAKAAAKARKTYSKGILSLWSTDKSTFPVVLFSLTALSFGVFSCVRSLAKNPDVQLDKSKRTNGMPYNPEESQEWRARRSRLAHMRPNAINQLHVSDSDAAHAQ